MTLFGVGEILGAFFIGFFIDKIGSKLTVFVNLTIIAIMGGVSLGYILVAKWNVLAWFMCFFWGFQDSAINTHCQEILGFEFDDNYTPFSLFNIWSCLMVIVFQLIESTFKNDTQAYIIYTVAVTALALIMNSVTYFFPFREHLAQTVDIHNAGSPISG
jgi:MFS family permease